METQRSLEARQFLTFSLRGEEFGIGILQIKEILEYGTITRVPMVPEFIQGVINLRGNVVPVVDLGGRFQMSAGEVTTRSCIVIVEVAHAGEGLTMGLMVDSVSEVLEIASSEIESPPPFGAKVNVDFIQGMAKRDRKFIMLLDIGKILSGDEVFAAKCLREEIPVNQEVQMGTESR